MMYQHHTSGFNVTSLVKSSKKEWTFPFVFSERKTDIISESKGYYVRDL